MANEVKQTRGVLKEYFETGDRPTESQFGRLIDSTINQVSDAVFVDRTHVGLATDPVDGVRLTVGGDTHVKDASLMVDSHATVGGNTALGGSLSVTGETTLNGQINVNNTVVPSGPLNVEGNLTLDVGANPTVYTGNGTGLPHRFLQLTSSPQDASPSGLRAGGLVVSGSHGYGTAGRNDMVVQGAVGIGAPTIDPAFKFQMYDGYMALLKGPQNVAPSLFIQNGNEGLGLSSDRIYKSGNQRLTIQADKDIILWNPSGRLGFGVFQPTRDVEFAGQVLFQGAIEAQSAKVSEMYTPSAINDLTPKQYVDGQVSTTSQNITERIDTEVNNLNGRIDTINTNITNNYDTKTEVDNKIKEALPSGIIAMWKGTVFDVPTGWHLCDGSNGTPNLSDKFVMAAGSTYSPYSAGGIDKFYLSESQLPPHSHTTDEHGHTVIDNGHNHNDGLFDRLLIDNNAGTSAAPTDGAHPDFPHEPNILTSGVIQSSETGISLELETVIVNETGGGQPIDLLPPFFTLAYIMKL